MASETSAAIDQLDAMRQPRSHCIEAEVVAGWFEYGQPRLRGAYAIDLRPTVLLDDPHRMSVLNLAMESHEPTPSVGKALNRKRIYSEESFQPRCFQPNSPLRPRRFTYSS